MSHNLVVIGYGCPWNTPSHITQSLLKNLTGTTLEQDLSVIERLRSWAHKVYDPPALSLTELKNPYLVKSRQVRINEINSECDKIIKFIKDNHIGFRMTESN
jgi:hypothetical protein